MPLPSFRVEQPVRGLVIVLSLLEEEARFANLVAQVTAVIVPEATSALAMPTGRAQGTKPKAQSRW